MGRVFSNVVGGAFGRDATIDIPTVASITFSNGPLRMVHEKTRVVIFVHPEKSARKSSAHDLCDFPH